MGTELYSVTAIAEALRTTGGLYTAAAMKVGCSPNTIKNYVERHPELQAVRAEAKEGLLDLAEGTLFKQIENGNLTAVIFFLKCQGKARGYVERQEMTGAGGKPIAINTAEDLSTLSDDELRAIVNDAPGTTGSSSP